MNNFKYLRLSSEYLQEKLDTLKPKQKGIFTLRKKDREQSAFRRFLDSLFRS